MRACNKVGVSKPYFPSRCQPEKLFWRIFAKVLLLDIKHAAEGHLASSCVCVFRVVDRIQFFALSFRIVFDHNSQRTQYGHDALRAFVEIIPDRVFELRDIDNRIPFGHTNRVAEIPNCFRCIPAPAQAAQCRHARIVPAVNESLRHQCEQLSLAEHGVTQIQSCKFNLNRTGGNRQLFQAPVVKRTMVFEFQRAKGVRDIFDRIGDRMGIVIHWINDPFRPLAVVRHIHDAEKNRIAHVDIRRCHVDLRPQHMRSIFELSRAHALEQIEIFFNRSIPRRTVLSGLR